ncbi:acyltransferase [Falsiruegeria litorea]|nr:acyltransferase [Falsiruegeria litorea]
MRFLHDTQDTQTPIRFRDWFRQEVQGINRGPYWPVHPASMVTGWRNIVIGVETSPGMMPGCYIQGIGKITIGDYTQIGPNVTMISANHAPHDLREHIPSHVNIGAYCWLGAGSVILPGVTLGDFTIVGAGAIVTSSVPDGYSVLAGNPARVLKRLDPAECPRHQSYHEYCGFIPMRDFPAFRSAELTH